MPGHETKGDQADHRKHHTQHQHRPQKAFDPAPLSPPLRWCCQTNSRDPNWRWCQIRRFESFQNHSWAANKHCDDFVSGNCSSWRRSQIISRGMKWIGHFCFP